jgi:hypothetical protein
VRQAVNAVAGSTLLGLAVAKAGSAQLSPGPHRLVLATGYRPGLPRAVAFTVGEVVVTRLDREALLGRPALLGHEARHAGQWACWLGLPFLPAYALAGAWSWLRTGDPWSRNAFERRAGLAAGGYREAPPRPPLRRRPRRTNSGPSPRGPNPLALW